MSDLKSLVDRYERAMEYMARAATHAGGELWSLGYADIQYANEEDDTDATVKAYVGPCHFKNGVGPSLLDAVEDHMRKQGDTP